MSAAAPPPTQLQQRGSHASPPRHQATDGDDDSDKKKDGWQRAASAGAEQLMSALGWVFDLLTVLISLSDVVSDLVVAVQFWRAERYVWFWLVISSLILSNCLYTYFTVEYLVRKENWLGRRIANWYRPVQYALLFPVAQLLPTLRWLKEQLCGSADNPELSLPALSAAANQRWDFALDDHGTQFVKEEIAALGNVDLMRRLDTAIERHLQTHILFYIETVVESIPQSVIQMLAISFLGEASTWQLVSMSLSIASIVSKGYVISRSPVISMVFFKFLLGAHDVFSTFYIFSTLVSQYRSLEMPLFGSDFYVSYLSGIWIYSVVVVLFAGGLAWILHGIYEVYYHVKQGHPVTLADVGKGVGICVISVVAAVPLVIAATAMQLIWIVGWLHSQEPEQDGFPTAARLYSFVARGPSEEWTDRVFFIMSRQHEYATQMKWGTKPDSWPPRKEAHESMSALLQRTPFKAWYLAVHFVQYLSSCQSYYVSRRIGPRKALGVFIGVAITLYSILQSFTGTFAFISMGLHWEQQNTLQWVFFVGKCVSAFLLLCLLPWALMYLLFLYETGFLLQREYGQAENVRKWIREYHQPPHWAVIKHCVPTELLPADVVGYAVKFIAPDNLDLRSLTVAECQRLKLLAREEEERRDHDVPFPEAGSDTDENPLAPPHHTTRRSPSEAALNFALSLSDAPSPNVSPLHPAAATAAFH